MKKALKWIGIIFAAIIVLGVVVTALGGGENEPLETNDAQPATAQPEKKEEPKEENKITKENYDKIIAGDQSTGEGGMSIEEVVSILGEENSQMEMEGGDYASVTYGWITDDLTSVSITFTNDKVSSKLWSE